MADNFLAYPWNSSHPTSSNAFRDRIAPYPMRPTLDMVAEGDGTRNEAGHNWQLNTSSLLSVEGDITDLYGRQSPTSAKDGFGITYVSQNQSSVNQSKWFDVGDQPIALDGQAGNIYAKSSWLKEVTSCWFVTNALGTSNSNDCHAAIAMVGLRYLHPVSKRVIIYKCPIVLAGLGYNDALYGNDSPIVCGYELSNTDKNNVKNQELVLLGFRLQLKVERNSAVTFRSDTINCFVNSLTAGTGDGSNPYDPDGKRVIVRNSDTVFNDLDRETKFPIECR
jgi:hypothetical protein